MSSKQSARASQQSQSPNRRKKGSTLSMASHSARKSINKGAGKEEAIAKKIQDLFKDRDNKKAQAIKATIWDDKLAVYKKYRKEHESKINELDRERVKIQRRKKNKKEKMKALRRNTIDRLNIICKVIKQTFCWYDKLYYENDFYRNQKLLECQKEDEKDILTKSKKLGKKSTTKNIDQGDGATSPNTTKKTPKISNPSSIESSQDKGQLELSKQETSINLKLSKYQGKKFLDQLQKFFKSPFKDDQKFAIQYMAQLTRDRLGESEDAVNKLFYETIFNILLNSKDEINKHKSFEIISNLVNSDFQRHKLVEQQCFQRLFEKTYPVADSKDSNADMRILEKLSFLITLISFHKDMTDLIISQNILGFILKISDQKYPSAIRSNAVLAISLLTYNELLFDEIIKQGVIDLIMELCQDQDQDQTVKEFSTLALVHFALNKKSINILIDKGVLDLFDTFGTNEGQEENVTISTNISWIFLALCNNGITGSRMLYQGITRDMFLVSCNPEYQQIRHLVITGFAELGKSTENSNDKDSQYSKEKQRIKETSIVGMHEYLTQDAQRIINILLKFSISDDSQFQYTAFWALKDYILLTHDNLIPDITDIIQAFIIGCVTDHTNIQSECADAISFLVTHRLVYSSKLTGMETDQEIEAKIEEIKSDSIDNILDSIMYLSGNEAKSIGTTAFSTLSSLSKYSSTCRSVMAQIQRDIQMEPELTSKNYLEFVKKRLLKERIVFCDKINSDNAEQEFSGLYSLLRLAQDPNDDEIEAASNKYIEFISQPYDPDNWKYRMNEKYFLKVFIALKNTREPKILQKLLKVIQFYINIDEQYKNTDQDKDALDSSPKHQKFEATGDVKKIDISDDSRDNSCQQMIINPHTILWMLGIIEDQHSLNQKYLSCLTSYTLLNIVSKHEIQFDYQEVAIIKKFNKALQNIDVFDQNEIQEEPIEATQESQIQFSKKNDSNVNQMDETSENYAINQNPENMKSQKGDNSQGQHSIMNINSNDDAQEDDNAESDHKSRLMVLPIEQEVNHAEIDFEEPNNIEQNQTKDHDSVQPSSVGQPDGSVVINQSSEQYIINKSVKSGESVVQNMRDSKVTIGDPISSKKNTESRQKESIEAAEQLDLASKISQSIEGEQSRKSKKRETHATEISMNKSMTSQQKAQLQIDLDSNKLAELNNSKENLLEIMDQESPTYIEMRNKAKQHPNKSAKSRKSVEKVYKEKAKMYQLDDKISEKAGEKSGPSTKRKVGIFGKQSTRNMLPSVSNRNQSPSPHKSLTGDSIDTEKNEEIDVNDIDPEDHDAVDQHLRDSLIKAFMVIFTNDKSQHLLLNKDLIDIAFNCLEFCNECTVEAKRHVARLISIIFKFPQVQERLMATEVVQGICELLNQNKHIEIIRYTIKACTYISMNYDFIKQSIYSLDILKSMMQLLDKMNNRNDQFNIILTIKNILKGDKCNKSFFLENGGTQKFIDIILESNDLQIVEMCVHGIKEQASYKKFMVKIIQMEDITYKLKLTIEKCLNLTEDWHHDINLKDFEKAKKSLMEGDQSIHVKSKGQTPKNQSLELTQESKFSYSIDESQIQIPEFMKNDLEKLKLNSKEGEGQASEEFQVTRLGKIRNSTYYIVARAIKFGFEARFLLEKCNLTQKILKDLGLHKENDFIFQNLLLIVSNLKLENQAIVDLIGNHYDQIFDLIYETNDKDRRVSLLKVLINLILEASEQLSSNTALFQKIFEICKDQRSDESMIENVLWFSTSLCEQGLFNSNFHLIMQNMKQNQILLIIWKSLCSKSERIILQALRLLTNLAYTDTFRNLLFQYKDIFIQIKKISSSTDSLISYKIEIQTELCKCLDKITQVDRSEQSVDSHADSQKIDQIKIFNKYLINLAIQHQYSIKRLDSESEESDINQDLDKANVFQTRSNQMTPLESSNLGKINRSNTSPSNEFSQIKTQTDIERSQYCKQVQGLQEFGEPVLDDIERLQNSNEMVENIICTLSNISNDFSLHKELIQNGLIEVVKKFIDMYLQQAQDINEMGVNEVQEGLELNVMPVGALNLIKAVTNIIMNISSNSNVQSDCIQADIITVILRSLKLKDYEVTTNLYKAMGAYLISFNQEIRRRAVHQGCLQEMLQAHESSNFFRIRRVCSETLNSVAQGDPQMFELNDKLQAKALKQHQMAQQHQMGQDYNYLGTAPGAM